MKIESYEYHENKKFTKSACQPTVQPLLRLTTMLLKGYNQEIYRKYSPFYILIYIATFFTFDSKFDQFFTPQSMFEIHCDFEHFLTKTI